MCANSPDMLILPEGRYPKNAVTAVPDLMKFDVNTLVDFLIPDLTLMRAIVDFKTAENLNCWLSSEIALARRKHGIYHPDRNNSHHRASID